MISGYTSNSKLVELRKYKITDLFIEKYFGDGSVDNNGVDYDESVENELVCYYINGIKYIDDIINNITYFYYNPSVDDNFIDSEYIAKDSVLGVVGLPKINNDVFIDRQIQSAFDVNLNLEFIRSMVDLETYAGGGYYNIVNNT